MIEALIGFVACFLPALFILTQVQGENSKLINQLDSALGELTACRLLCPHKEKDMVRVADVAQSSTTWTEDPQGRWATTVGDLEPGKSATVQVHGSLLWPSWPHGAGNVPYGPTDV